MSALPIISLAGLSGDAASSRALATRVGAACRQEGFFYLVEHGVPASLTSAAFAASREFFAQPLALKQALSIRHSRHNRGYVAMADERLDPKAGADLKEAFNIGVDLPAEHPDVVAGKPFRGVNAWPNLPGFRLPMLEYFDACLALGRRLHRLLALDLGVPAAFFDPHLTHPLATLRLLRYPPGAGESSRHDAGAGTHTDYGNVTLLATDEVGGLEVAARDGRWIDAPHVPGSFVCNIGDGLMRWSNDVYVSTPHRVRRPLAERHSIAFFSRGQPRVGDRSARYLPRPAAPLRAGALRRLPRVTPRRHLRLPRQTVNGLPRDAGMLVRIQVGLREMTTSTAMVAR